MLKRLWAIMLQRCPVCLEGKVFKSLLGIYPNCPHCGVKYERETGYFLNAMFVAYTLGFLLLIPLAVLLYFLNASILLFTVIVSVFVIIVWPLLFRYSRIIWMHADQVLDPRQPETPPAGATQDLAAQQ